MKRFALALCVTTVIGSSVYANNPIGIEEQRKSVARSIPLSKPANDVQASQLSSPNNLQVSQKDLAKRAKSLRKSFRKEEKAKRKLARKISKYLKKRNKQNRKMNKLKAKALRKMAKSRAKALKRLRKRGIKNPEQFLNQSVTPAQSRPVRTVTPAANVEVLVAQHVPIVRAAVPPAKKEEGSFDKKKQAKTTQKGWFSDNNNENTEELFRSLLPDAQLLSLDTDIQYVGKLLSNMTIDKDDTEFLALENLENFIDAWEQVVSARAKIGILELPADNEKSQEEKELKVKLREVAESIIEVSTKRVDELSDYLGPLERTRLFSIDEEGEEKAASQALMDVNDELEKVNKRYNTFNDTFKSLQDLLEGSTLLMEFPALLDLVAKINKMNISAGTVLQRLELLQRNYTIWAQEEAKQKPLVLTATIDVEDEGLTPRLGSEQTDEDTKPVSTYVDQVVLEMQDTIKEAQDQISRLKEKEGLDFSLVPTWYSLSRKQLKEEIENNMDVLGHFQAKVNELADFFSLEELEKLLSVSASILAVKDLNLKDLSKLKMYLGWIQSDLQKVEVKPSEDSQLLDAPEGSHMLSTTPEESLHGVSSPHSHSPRSSRLEVNVGEVQEVLTSAQEKLDSLMEDRKSVSILKEDIPFLKNLHENLLLDLDRLVETNKELETFKNNVYDLKEDKNFSLDKLGHMLLLGKSILTMPSIKYGNFYHMRERLSLIEGRLEEISKRAKQSKPMPSSKLVKSKRSTGSVGFTIYEDSPSSDTPMPRKPASEKKSGLSVRSNNIQSGPVTMEDTKRRERQVLGQRDPKSTLHE